MKTRQLIKKLFIFIFVIFLTGCISDGSSSYEKSLSEITLKNHRQYFVIGKTTKRDAFQVLGPPQQETNKESGETEWHYFYNKESVYVPVIAPLPINLSESKRISLLFNSKEVLKDVSFVEK